MADDSSAPTGLFGIDPNLLLNLGIGLMSGASYGSNAGKGLMEGMGNYYNQKMAKQDLALKQQQYGMNNLSMQKTMQLLNMVGQLSGDPVPQGQGAPPSGAGAPNGLLPGASSGGPQQQGPGLLPGVGTPVSQGANGAQSFPLASSQAVAAGPASPPQGQIPIQAPQQPSTPSWLTPPSMGSISQMPVNGINPRALRAYSLLNGKDPIESSKAIEQQQIEQAQRQYQPTIGKLDTLIKSDDPVAYMRADTELASAWPELARRQGLDASNPSPQAVRTAFTFGRNALASSLQLPTIAPIVPHKQVTGEYGQVMDVDPVTNEEKQVTAPSYPSFSLQSGETVTGQKYAVPVQTGGYRAGGGVSQSPSSARKQVPAANQSPATAGNQGNQAGPSGVTAPPSGAVSLGYGQPSNDQAKAAALANYARDNIQSLNKMETGGFRLSPKARTVLINAAMNEDPGMLSQLASQEALAHGVSDQDLAYASSAFPILQAAGHSMSGARLTASQMRTNFESLLPVESDNKDYLGNVQSNRQKLYTGLLGEAGPAAYLPEYRNTLGADVQGLGKPGAAPTQLAPGQSRVIGGVTITRLPNGGSPQASTGTTGRW